ncbi:ParB/RepB/Spo0J family partition protein [bacterium]|nr:ParB/RepB/Spo0J family partition protein [bacterium]
MKLPSVDDLFSTEESRQEAKLAKIYDIPVSEIDDFPDHPYRVLDDEDMQALMDSISDRGVITPAMVRKKENGRYEMISGHRRKRACERLGLETLRCEVVEVSRDEAVILMVDSNSQRSKIAPTDKGKAYKMKLDAMNRQGIRSDLTFSPVGKKLENGKDLAKEVGDSQTQIYRYIRLTNLVPELQQFVDEGKIKMRPAVELSYLDEETQRDVVDRIDETEAFPSHDQAIRIRKAFESGAIDYEKVVDIMAEEKPNQKPKFKFSFERLRPLIPQGYADKQAEDYVIKALENNQTFERLRPLIPQGYADERAEDYVIKALEYYKKYLQKQRDQAR